MPHQVRKWWVIFNVSTLTQLSYSRRIWIGSGSLDSFNLVNFFSMLRINKQLPFDFFLAEHLQKAFTDINPFRTVPAIDDNGFKMMERFIHNIFIFIFKYVWNYVKFNWKCGDIPLFSEIKESSWSLVPRGFETPSPGRRVPWVAAY